MKNIVFAIAAFLLFTAVTFAQGTIQGRVLDEQANAIGEVELTAAGPGGAATATTDEDGGFIFEELEAGSYKVSVKAPAGFQDAVQNNVIVKDDEDTTISFVLKKVAAASAATKPGRANAQNADWPQAKFRFEIEFTVDGKTNKIEAQEVSGFDIAAQPIEYRAGDSKVFSVQTMPGLKKYSDITIKKGIFKSDNKLFDWYKRIQNGQISRSTVVVKLLDEDGKPTMVWTLKNALPKKITGNAANGFESIVLAHEGIEIANQ